MRGVEKRWSAIVRSSQGVWGLKGVKLAWDLTAGVTGLPGRRQWQTFALNGSVLVSISLSWRAETTRVEGFVRCREITCKRPTIRQLGVVTRSISHHVPASPVVSPPEQ